MPHLQRLGARLDDGLRVLREVQLQTRVLEALEHRDERGVRTAVAPVEHEPHFVLEALRDQNVLVLEHPGRNRRPGHRLGLRGIDLHHAQRDAQLELVGHLRPQRTVAAAPDVVGVHAGRLGLQTLERRIQILQHGLVHGLLRVVGERTGLDGVARRLEHRQEGDRSVGIGEVEQVVGLHDTHRGGEVELAFGVALLDQAARIVDDMQHEVLVHAAAVAAVDVVALVREVSVGALEVPAENVDLQVRPVLEQVLLVRVAVTHRLQELRLEGQIGGIHFDGIGVQLLEIAGTASQQSDRESQSGVSDNILEFHSDLSLFVRS